MCAASKMKVSNKECASNDVFVYEVLHDVIKYLFMQHKLAKIIINSTLLFFAFNFILLDDGSKRFCLVFASICFIENK